MYAKQIRVVQVTKKKKFHRIQRIQSNDLKNGPPGGSQNIFVLFELKRHFLTNHFVRFMEFFQLPRFELSV